MQSNNGCIQILPILWMPDQVRHDGTHIVIPANPGSRSSAGAGIQCNSGFTLPITHHCSSTSGYRIKSGMTEPTSSFRRTLDRGPGQGPGIQSNNGCIQILPILWMPDQVRHDSMRPSCQPASQNATADRFPQYVDRS